jgi:hypothetical protein
MRAEEQVLRAVEPAHGVLAEYVEPALRKNAEQTATGLIAVPNADELWKRSGRWTRRPDLIV